MFVDLMHTRLIRAAADKAGPRLYAITKQPWRSPEACDAIADSTEWALRHTARGAIELADVTKFDRAVPGFTFDLSEVGIVVTDDRIWASTRDALEATGVRVVEGQQEGRP